MPLEFPDLVGFGLSVGLVAAIAVAACLSPLPSALKALICAALVLRVFGSWLRYFILFEVYDGSGDARRYYARGIEYADRFLQWDFSPFYDPELWLRGQWWGTSFISFPSGIVLTGVGPSLLGGFVIFSLLTFLGLVGFVVAFRRACPHVPAVYYARWVWLFPSLWYWPSSIGKDALVLMGIGIAVWGFIGKRGRISWLLLVTGLFFVFAIRPQVAAVVILSFVLAHWLSLGTRWTARKAIQGGAILAFGMAGIWLSMTFIGVDGFDAEGVQAYMEDQSARAAVGGSGIENVSVGISGIPMAVINILFRPFLWEAHNAMALLSAVEISAMWMIVWYRRHNFVHALRHWRSHPLLRVAVPFILLYSATLGMLIINLGIIARQRVFLFPFLFLMLEALPAAGRKARSVRRAPSKRPVERVPVLEGSVQ